MATTNVSEFALFKLCTEQPRSLDKSLSQLNLTFVKDTKQGEAAEADAEDNSIECRQRKALRLYQMIWSGLTKILVSNV